MAKRLAIPSKYVELEIVGPLGSYFASRVQRVTANADMPTNTIDELGNSGHAGTSKDLPSVTVTFQAMDVGINLIAALTGEDQDSFPAGGVELNTELDRAIDAILRIRDDEVAQYVKACHLRRCQIQNFTYNYSVDGDSTEEYTIIGSEKRWFTNDVVVEVFTTGTTTFVLSESVEQLKNGNYLLSVVLDEEYLEEVTSGATSGEYSYNDGSDTITTGDSRTNQLVAVYQSQASGDAWSDIDETEQPAAIRGKDVDVQIGANDILRVQAVTVNGTFNPQPVREMGNRKIVGYQGQVLEVTGTVTILDTDTELVRLFTGAESGDTEFEIGACAASGVSLEITLSDPYDCAAPYNALKTVYLDEISITSDGYTSNVNDNATQTFDWRSDTGSIIIYSGAKP
jgi:hypothetical protein